MAERRPAYDETERERIRRALQRYRNEHKVGVPALQLRIAEIIGDGNPDRVPLKSLQRFLAGTHRTDDALVHHCINFLTKVAPPPAEERLAEMLSAFMMGKDAPDVDCAGFAGTWHGRFRNERALMLDDEFEAGYSVLHLKPSGNPQYLNAEEFVFNPERDCGQTFRNPDWFRAKFDPGGGCYSGIFMPYVGGDRPRTSYLLLLRNYLRMHQYLLRPSVSVSPGALIGNGLEPPTYWWGVKMEWHSDFYIAFTPAPEEAQEC